MHSADAVAREIEAFEGAEGAQLHACLCELVVFCVQHSERRKHTHIEHAAGESVVRHIQMAQRTQRHRRRALGEHTRRLLSTARAEEDAAEVECAEAVVCKAEFAECLHGRKTRHVHRRQRIACEVEGGTAREC